MKCLACGSENPRDLVIVKCNDGVNYFACLSCHYTADSVAMFSPHPGSIIFNMPEKEYKKHKPTGKKCAICGCRTSEVIDHDGIKVCPSCSKDGWRRAGHGSGLLNNDLSDDMIAEEIAPLTDAIKKLDGIKYDKGKRDWTLLPWESLEEVVKVLEFGANKYARDNWKKVIPKERYQQAAMRHFISDINGERLDPESGLAHKAHAMCCLLFGLWFDMQEERDD